MIKLGLHGTKIQKKVRKNMNLVNERLLVVKDHLEDEMIQLSDIIVCMQVIESGFDYGPGDKQKQETAFVRTLSRLLQVLLTDLKGNYATISELINKPDKN